MDKSAQDKRITDDRIATAQLGQRRLFLKSLDGGVLGATAVRQGLGFCPGDDSLLESGFERRLAAVGCQ